MRHFRPLAILPFLALALGVGASPARSADAPAWKLDPDKSHIRFTGTQMRVPSKGEFKKFKADIRFDPENLAGSKVVVTVETASARTGNGKIDKELRRELWFQVDKYPTATFTVSKFVAKGDGSYDAVAQLKIRDQTKEVTLPFKLEVSGNRAKASGTLMMKRLDFGVGRDEWKDTSIVADEVTVTIEVEAIRN